MILTFILSLIVILSVLLMLYSAVALIQKKALFFSAPKDVQSKIIDRTEERFNGARMLGFKLFIISVIGFVGAFIYGAIDGIQKNFSIMQFFIRFITMLYIYKAFDIICFDWLLLTKSHFFQHYYPETEGCEGYRQFGFNRKSQLIKIIVFPFTSAVAAMICHTFI